MKVLAKSVKGQEFFYSPRSAHRVPRYIEQVCFELNQIRHDLKDNEVWHIHDVDRYDVAYDYAMTQSFLYRNSYLVERH